MSDFTNIRPATGVDLEAIGEIAKRTELFPAEMVGDMAAGYTLGTSSDIWFVYEDDSRVLAFGFCEPERMTVGTWNLLAIGVTPEMQGNFIGAQMMAYLEAYLSRQGARILLVETMGTPEFARTREFYLKNNYVEEARIREFYEAGADKVVFWKHL